MRSMLLLALFGFMAFAMIQARPDLDDAVPDPVKDAVKSVEGAADPVEDAVEGAADPVEDAVEGAADAVEDAAKPVEDAVEDAAEGVGDKKPGLPELPKPLDGIKKVLDDVKEKIEEVVESILDGKKVLPV